MAISAELFKRLPKQRGNPRRWTPVEDEIVRTHGAKEAAEKLGISENAVRVRQRRIGAGLERRQR
jgi:hypothetical protein